MEGAGSNWRLRFICSKNEKDGADRGNRTPDPRITKNYPQIAWRAIPRNGV
jgi:hypothetical protein